MLQQPRGVWIDIAAHCSEDDQHITQQGLEGILTYYTLALILVNELTVFQLARLRSEHRTDSTGRTGNEQTPEQGWTSLQHNAARRHQHTASSIVHLAE